MGVVLKAGREIDPGPKGQERADSVGQSTGSAPHDGFMRRLNRHIKSAIFKIFGNHKESRDSELPIVADRRGDVREFRRDARR